MKTLLSIALLLASSLASLAQERTRPRTRPAPFHVEEKTIARSHAALRTRQVTCRELVEAYLARINAYDQKGPSLNAVVLLNTSAGHRTLCRVAVSNMIWCTTSQRPVRR